MKLIRLLATALVASSIFSAGARATERPRADVACTPTEQKLVYDCTIMLTGKKTGAAMDGVEFTVKAHMPSMPMAHNMKPVKAMPAGKPGMYRAKIELGMYGEWALKMDISSPARDAIIQKMHFGASKGESGSPDIEQRKHKVK